MKAGERRRGSLATSGALWCAAAAIHPVWLREVRRPRGDVDGSDDGGTTWRHVSDSSFYAARFSPDGSVLWVCGNGQLGRYPAATLGW